MGAIRGFAFAATFLVIGCNNGPSKADIDKMIDARLAERGLVPAGSSTAAASGSASAVAAKTSAPTTTKGAAGPVEESLAFLARLDELMKDYVPEDPSDLLRCVTSDAVKNNADLQKVAATLNQERKRKESEFFGPLYALAFHYDLDWQTRKDPASPPVYGCWGTGWIDLSEYSDQGKSVCKGMGDWKVKSQGHPAWFTYSRTETAPTRPPELMRRMEGAGIKVPGRFSCRVSDVVSDKDRTTVKCGQGSSAPRVRLNGAVKPVNSGDVVSVPLADAKRDPDGVLFKTAGTRNAAWIVDADAASVTVDAAATCPSIAEILASLPKK